jgi:uncharacterized protein YoxC
VNWQVFFIGVIAVSVFAIAVGQVILAIHLSRLAKHASGLVQQVQKEVRPLIDKVQRIADDAERVSELAVVQVERIDRMISRTSDRVDDTLGLLQRTIERPVRQGSAILAAVRAALGVLQSWPRRAPAMHDDEDPLFVG